MRIRLAACIVMAAASSPVSAGSDSVPDAGQATAPQGAGSRDGDSRATGDVQVAGQNGDAGAASGEPRRPDAETLTDAAAKKGVSGWFPDATLNEYDWERSKP